jgi:hypothetical protein
MAQTVAERQRLEMRIARALVRKLLDEGMTINVFDGEEVTLNQSSSEEDIMAALRTTDEDILYVYQGETRMGFIHLVYGNDGWDVIADNSTRLESIIAPVSAYAESFAG